MYSSLSFNNDRFLPDLVFFILPHTLKLTATFAKANPKHGIIFSVNPLHILAETIEQHKQLFRIISTSSSRCVFKKGREGRFHKDGMWFSENYHDPLIQIIQIIQIYST